ncbi:MAG TPA: hypothetical protein VFZ87_09040 [Gemmatimonadales bacterium]
MSAVRLPAERIGKAALLIAILLAPTERAEAQVGLASRESRIVLIAQVPSGASLQAVSSPRVLGMPGSVREATVTVRLASSSGYRLLVHGTTRGYARAGQSERIWVRGLDGRFHELQENSPVTVAQDQRPAGELDRHIVYRFETAGPADQPVSLPVRYEIAVSPTL